VSATPPGMRSTLAALVRKGASVDVTVTTVAPRIMTRRRDPRTPGDQRAIQTTWR